MSGPTARLVLLEDFKRGVPGKAGPDTEKLREQLSGLPEFREVELSPYTQSTVIATVPARNARERDRLKALVNEKVDGWRVIEEDSYSLPKTF